MTDRGMTNAELAGDVVEVIDAPEADGVYLIRRRSGESGASILFYSLVYSSYMPTLEGARSWAANDAKQGGRS